MTSRQLPMKQFAAIVTGQIGPPWRLAIQPGHPAGTRVSLRSLIAELSATEVIVFLELRSPAIFSFSSGTLSVDMQEYLFARSYLSRDDLHALLELCSSLDLSLVSIGPDWTAVGIQGTMGNISQIGFAPVTAVSVQQPPGGGPNPGGAAANPGAVTMTVSNNKGIVWPGVAIAGGGGAATAGWLGLGVVWKAILGGDLAETAALAAGEDAAAATLAGDTAALGILSGGTSSPGAAVQIFGGSEALAVGVVAAAPELLIVAGGAVFVWGVWQLLSQDSTPP